MNLENKIKKLEDKIALDDVLQRFDQLQNNISTLRASIEANLSKLSLNRNRQVIIEILVDANAEINGAKIFLDIK